MVKKRPTNPHHLANPRLKKKLKSDDDNHEKMDRISCLPDHIHHEILSHLPPKDFAATSVLSKTWNAACKSSPFLRFDQHSFQEASYRKGIGSRQSVKDFCDHVDKTLLARRTSFPGPTAFQFVVNFASCKSKLDPRLDRWLNYAFRSDQTKEVVVKYSLTTRRKGSRRQLKYYAIPPEFFSAKSSLERIELFGCRVMKKGPLLGFWPSLRKLVLVHVEIDREILESVTWKNLEELRMESCVGFEEVRIRAPKLERAHVWFSMESEGGTVVGIDAPRIASITWGGNCRSLILSIRASSGTCGNLKEVKVYGSDEAARRVLVEEVIPASFPTVEKVWNWRGIAGTGWEKHTISH